LGLPPALAGVGLFATIFLATHLQKSIFASIPKPTKQYIFYNCIIIYANLTNKSLNSFLDAKHFLFVFFFLAFITNYSHL
jgi:hypothetical protein